MDIRHHPTPPPPTLDREKLGQIVLVLQGGGALGAYQVGVYQALSEAGIEPDWVIGTSIGAINAGIIAGNRPENRLAKIEQFWNSVRQGPLTQWAASIPGWGAMANAMTITQGLPGFFTPNPLAALGDSWPMDPESAGYYSTQPLARTLEQVIDTDVLASCSPRLTVGAANVRTGEMHYFDSTKQPLTIKHIMASGALPPAFPAVRIDGDLYWDGGILSNTPVEAVFDDNPRRSGLVFVVHIWQPHGPEPDSLRAVMSRQKDVQYASRATAHIDRQRQLHRLRHVVTELASLLPDEMKDDPRVQALRGYGCLTRMHVVRLTAPSLPGEDHTKDIDFSVDGVKARSDAGYSDATRVLAQRPWEGEFDPTEGLILHNGDANSSKDFGQ